MHLIRKYFQKIEFLHLMDFNFFSKWRPLYNDIHQRPDHRAKYKIQISWCADRRVLVLNKKNLTAPSLHKFINCLTYFEPHPPPQLGGGGVTLIDWYKFF